MEEFNKTFDIFNSYPKLGIQDYRDNVCPILKNSASGKEEEYKIDFSSQIKFNCLIRDMNPQQKVAKSAEDNIWVFLKGAPDKVWTRCSSILVEGKQVKLDAEIVKELEDANELFGNMGERVLGFSRIKLDPVVKDGYYSKSKLYECKKW